MLLTHASTLTQARSHLAALADHASSLEASSAYEHVLIELDRIHDDTAPALEAIEPTCDGEILYALATAAIENLTEHGIDRLLIELVLIMLNDAQRLESA